MPTIALQRPVLSPDGTHLAVVTPDQSIALINLAEAAYGHRFISFLDIPRGARNIVKECKNLRWSPEVLFQAQNADDVLSNTKFGERSGLTWLLLSNGSQLVALRTQLRTPRAKPSMDGGEGIKSMILADYDLGDQFGKLSVVEFVFNHRYALVMFEYGISAMLLSLAKPQRDEITQVKFHDSRSLARSPDSKSFALLRRDGTQDKITVFEQDDSQAISYKSFMCNTVDAQSVTWCPAEDHLLAVLESPAYGVKVVFYTAQGHALKQLDIGSSLFSLGPASSPYAWSAGDAKQVDEKIEGVGLVHWKWMGYTKDKTIQAMATGQREVLLRYQNTKSISTQTLCRFNHPDVVDGSNTYVWQEVASAGSTTSAFTRQSGVFEPMTPVSGGSSDAGAKATQATSGDQTQVESIYLNANHSLVATRLRSCPHALWIWKPADVQHNTHPHTVLMFAHSIRQILFHPILPGVLIVLTASKVPTLYAWYEEAHAPVSGTVPINTSVSTAVSGSWLPECTIGGGTAKERCLFMLTSNAAFEVGHLCCLDGRVVFASAFQQDSLQAGGLGPGKANDEDETSGISIDTPSRAPRKRYPADGPAAAVGRARDDADSDAATDQDDSLSVPTAYRTLW